MTALSGVFVKVGTMADGTCRITIDLDCTLSQLGALNLMPGTPLAIARLTNEAGTAAIQPEPEPVPEPAKGGALAKWAALRCGDPEFLKWGNYEDADEAAADIRFVCEVESRAELDNNPQAAAIFNEKFRLPYMAYCQGRTK